ncbi:EAL domain-containing protein [Devosia sp. BK]|uniref:putative bifunctional diguanylate cyclase/phosphodiesterase n=1 Tax=Devosia sp. BK TaxID=2871706 RepID=UPI00293A1449|nr:EAL domain-containing protein [Devosia sp. BK]MDV3252667.1 EAL domain-containing protein [Devosia sp. BK]
MIGLPLLRPALKWTSSGALLTLIAIGGVVTIGLVLASAIWASRESDLAALDRQRELSNTRLSTQIERVAHELDLMAEGYASSISTVDETNVSPQDGKGFSHLIKSIFGYDQVFVIDGDGKLALETDAEIASRYDWAKPLLLPLLTRLRQQDEPLPVVELMRLEGRPSIAGIKAITLGSQPVAPTNRLYLIAYRYIDGPALDAFSREQGLNGARFARAADPDIEEVTFEIRATSTGEPIGFIIWTPDLPGSRVVSRLLPALAASALIIASLLAMLMLLLKKSMSELTDSEQKARRQSLHDALTDLPNRILFGRRLTDCLEDQRLNVTRSIVALIDLDKFKTVNDTFGHGAGDELLTAVADRIRALLGPNDTLARLGGDEFALLLPDRAKTDRSHLELFQRIITSLNAPFPLLDGKVTATIGCSIGATSLTSARQTTSEVLHLADIALYEAKSTGRNRCVEYSARLDSSAQMRAELKSELQTLLSTGGTDPQSEFGLEVFFQTIHCTAPGHAVSGAEALVRWRHETHGLLTPDKFITLAEDSGMIHELGMVVLERACAAATGWDSTQFVSVNVSPLQLRRPDYVDAVVKVLKQTGLAAERLELELTETALLDADEAVVSDTLARLRDAGIKIALDDFGTGYSSLSHLVRFGIDRIKIDRSFVKLLGSRADGAAVVSAIVALSHSLGLSTTAEGVETEGQRDFLVAAGCNDLQGFLLSKPVPNPDMGVVDEAATDLRLSGPSIA